jgi:hypothetical protein
MSLELAAAMRLLDAAKAAGFRFTRIAPGHDGPLWGVRETPEYSDRIYLGGFDADCHAIRSRRSSLVMPRGLPVTERVSGDALSVLHTAVWDWAESAAQATNPH